jgi:hypothetical protein
MFPLNCWPALLSKAAAAPFAAVHRVTIPGFIIFIPQQNDSAE